MIPYRATHLIAKPHGDHKCFYCSAPADRPLKLSSAFTEWWAVDQPESNHVCAGCQASMDEKRNIDGYEKPQKTRTFSWLVTPGKMLPFTKRDKARLLFTLSTPPLVSWSLALADSGQKQILYRTPVNHCAPPWTVQLELEQVSYVPDELRERLELTRRVVAAVGHKGAKEPGVTLALCTDDEIAEQWFSVLHDPLTRLCLFICPSQKECKNANPSDAGRIQAATSGS